MVGHTRVGRGGTKRCQDGRKLKLEDEEGGVGMRWRGTPGSASLRPLSPPLPSNTPWSLSPSSFFRSQTYFLFKLPSCKIEANFLEYHVGRAEANCKPTQMQCWFSLAFVYNIWVFSLLFTLTLKTNPVCAEGQMRTVILDFKAFQPWQHFQLCFVFVSIHLSSLSSCHT